MVVRKRETYRPQEFPTALDSDEGLNLLRSLLQELEQQDQMEGAAGNVSRLGGHSPLPGEVQEPLDKERVVRRIIQRLSEES
jgi:hypothetical protein